MFFDWRQRLVFAISVFVFSPIQTTRTCECAFRVLSNADGIGEPPVSRSLLDKRVCVDDAAPSLNIYYPLIYGRVLVTTNDIIRDLVAVSFSHLSSRCIRFLPLNSQIVSLKRNIWLELKLNLW